jgi:ornithine cyclodeaminase
VQTAKIVVEWRGAATSPPPAGAVELQGADPASIAELGEVLAQTRPGRRSPEEVILYKSTGLAVEDAVTARLVYERALKEGAGAPITL